MKTTLYFIETDSGYAPRKNEFKTSKLHYASIVIEGNTLIKHKKLDEKPGKRFSDVAIMKLIKSFNGVVYPVQEDMDKEVWQQVTSGGQAVKTPSVEETQTN